MEYQQAFLLQLLDVDCASVDIDYENIHELGLYCNQNSRDLRYVFSTEPLPESTFDSS